MNKYVTKDLKQYRITDEGLRLLHEVGLKSVVSSQ
jgi:DNA-binding PadR family transcriptional regulator